MVSFIFGGNTGETPASIAQKRALVAQIMGTARTPQTFGEGLSALGDGIVANVLGGRAADAEKTGQSSANDTFSQLVASITGQGGASMPRTASDATAAMAGGDFLSGLVQSESGGNWNALNSEGYGGRLQFGDDRLADAAAAGLVPQGTTGAMFSRMSPEQQQAVENWHFNDIEQQAERMGLSQYYGQTIAGVPITPESVKAMAHLGGIGGAQKFITSGGQYNPADSNGTRLSDYGTRFGGSGGGRAQVAQGPDLAMLMEASANPWLSDSQKSVINSMIAQQMQQMDPAYQQGLRAGDLGIQKAELELEALRNKPPPLPGAPKTEKIFDPETGREKVVQWNESTGAWEDLGGVSAPKDPLVQVNTGDGAPGLGKLSTDYGYVLDPVTGQPVIDPATGLPTAAPVPGSPAAVAAQRAATQAGVRQDQSANAANIVLEDIDRALGQVSGWTAGAGSLLSNIPGTGAVDLSSSLDTIKANIGFDRLQQMREASPTGGALGGIAVEELRMLQSVMGSLNTAQTPEQLKANLERLKQVYEPIAAKAAAYPNAGQFGFGGGPSLTPPAEPTDIDALLEKYQ